MAAKTITTKKATPEKPVAEKKEKKPKTNGISLPLTRDELKHLRDLMSIVLPPEGDTVSKVLASLGKNQVKEALLWQKVADLCVKNGLAIGADAPDFYIDQISPPVLDVVASGSEE